MLGKLKTKSKYLQRVLDGEDPKIVILEMESLINKMNIEKYDKKKAIKKILDSEE